jgi:hypothetical protein
VLVEVGLVAEAALGGGLSERPAVPEQTLGGADSQRPDVSDKIVASARPGGAGGLAGGISEDGAALRRRDV